MSERTLMNALGATVGFADIDALNFRREVIDVTVNIDNIRVFAAGESFVNFDKVNRYITELRNVCSMGADGAPVDFLGEAAVKTAAGVASTAATTVTFEDSKGYFNGTNIIFPLFANTTDIAVRIQDGTLSTTKRFKNVTIPPAYGNIVKTPAQTVSAAANFNAGTITADVRNASSDQPGRLKVLAAVYKSGGAELIKAAVLEDTFGTDGRIDCVIDLSGITVPSDATVKLFIWDGTTLAPLA